MPIASGMLVGVLLLFAAAAASAQDSRKPVVYNHVTEEGAGMDQLVHETYDAAFKVVDVSDSDGIYVPPHLLYGPKPTVPSTEADGPLAGTVVVFFLITPDGQVKEPVIITSSEPRLNAEVLATLRRWIFTPARINGRPVPVTGGQQFTVP